MDDWELAFHVKSERRRRRSRRQSALKGAALLGTLAALIAAGLWSVRALSGF